MGPLAPILVLQYNEKNLLLQLTFDRPLMQDNIYGPILTFFQAV